MPRKKKQVKIKPDLSPMVKGAALIQTGWHSYPIEYQNLTSWERGQIALYLDNKGWGELPERFTDNEDRVRQFQYTPQQKRGGKIPKEVLDG